MKVFDRRETETSTAPAWLEKLVIALTPPQSHESREFAFRQLWKQYPSLRQCLPRLPGVIASPVFNRARNAFYWQMAIAQACILLMPFASIMSGPMAMVLGLVLVCLIFWEAYIEHDQRPDCEAITTFMAPALVVLFGAALKFAFPAQMPSLETILTGALKSALPIALVRFGLSTDPAAQHPFQGLLRIYNRTQFLNCVWGGGGIALMTTNNQAVHQDDISSNVIVGAAMTAFAVAKYLPQNPIAGIYRHRRIRTTVGKDPYRDEVVVKRYQLLTGADWFRDFGLQAFLEILSFAIALLPLLIGLWRLYSPNPDVAATNWAQFLANGLGWMALILTWGKVKQMNRKTAGIMDRELMRTVGQANTLNRAPLNPEK